MKIIHDCPEVIDVSNTITDYKLTSDKIEITTGDGKQMELDKTNNYVNLLNGIINTQRQYSAIREKKVLEERLGLNKKSIMLMFVILLGGVSFLTIIPNIFTSLLFLISLVMLCTSICTRFYIKKEIMEKGDIITNKDQIKVCDVINDDLIKIEDEILYLDEEENNR